MTSLGPLLADAAVPLKPSPWVLVAFAAYMIGVFVLGALAHHLLERGSFLKEYFLGDRKLNAWVLSLTYVATSVSAGSFMGFPSYIYLHGWILALWIGGYMVSGLTTKGVLAKRLNQVSRLSGSITVPDVLRDRFQSPALGLLAGILLVVFLIFNLVAQFKAGGVILQQAAGGVSDVRAYQAVRGVTKETLTGVGAWTEPGPGEDRKSLYDHGYPDYVLGILIFAVTVVAYTTYGGFWAVTWTDVLQGLVMVAGALLLMVLSLRLVGGLDNATRQLIHEHETALARGDPRDIDRTQLVTGPGPDDFVPISMAVSMFFLWTIGAMGQPVGMVRLMACRDTPTLRRSLFMIGIYYALIYLPLVIAFVCARSYLGDRYAGVSDKIMPIMALTTTQDFPLLGGLILAAPYAAAMSAVAGFLLLMSSSLVRDIYQRNINPTVSPRLVRWVSYGTTAVVGSIVTIAALHPPRYLQQIIIFTGAGMGCTFLAPTVLALYWRRATRAGALAALLGGFGTIALLNVLGWYGVGKRGLTGPAADPFAPVYLFGLDPMIPGLVVSFALGIGVSLLTRPLPEEAVDYYFVASETKGAS